MAKGAIQITACILGFAFSIVSIPASEQTPTQALGKALFQDKSLSTPPGQSCASCHDPAKAFSAPNGKTLPVGAVTDRMGTRKIPSIAYAKFVPEIHFVPGRSEFQGGLFLDGRAKNLEAQVRHPLLNPLEMNNKSIEEVVSKVKQGPYANQMKAIYGVNIFSDPKSAFQAMTSAIAAYERGPEFAKFTSKYDAYLAGKETLTPQELRGLVLFSSERTGCAHCHPSAIGPGGAPPLFTNFLFDNIGVPFNKKYPHILRRGPRFDKGLSTTTKRDDDEGKFRTPSLRNVAVTGPYFHNGVYQTLEEVVGFYARIGTPTADKPEFPESVNSDELKAPKLTEPELADLVAFLRTLTDR